MSFVASADSATWRGYHLSTNPWQGRDSLRWPPSRSGQIKSTFPPGRLHFRGYESMGLPLRRSATRERALRVRPGQILRSQDPVMWTCRCAGPGSRRDRRLPTSRPTLGDQRRSRAGDQVTDDFSAQGMLLSEVRGKSSRGTLQ